MIDALAPARLYGILDLGYVGPDRTVERTLQVLAGGVGVLQLRAKGHPPSTIVALARAGWSSFPASSRRPIPPSMAGTVWPCWPDRRPNSKLAGSRNFPEYL